MLRLRQYVEDEFDRSFEVPGEEDLEFTRKFDAAAPWRLGVTDALLFLELLEVVVQPIHAVVPCLLVLDQPLA